MAKEEKTKRASLWDGVKMYGAENTKFFDKICAFLLVMSPILQHYIGLYENAGFTVLLIAAPFVFLRLLKKLDDNLSRNMCVAAVIPIVLFEVYSIFNRSFGFNQLIYGGFMALFLFAVAMGCVNISYVIKCATAVANCAAVLIIIQYISYYILDIRIRPVPVELLHSESERWDYIISEYIIGAVYRPAAFFLEPSHLFLFCFPIICLLLLLPGMTKARFWSAAFISLAVIMSTSGMGIMVTAGLWGLYLVFFRGENDERRILNFAKLFTGRSFLIIMAFIIVAGGMYLSLDVIRSSIDRIFSNDDGSTAIEGRVRLASNLVKTLSGRSLIFGVTTDISISDFDNTFPGFFATLYKRGIVGVVLSYWFYAQGFFKLKTAYFWLTFIIVVISFFTAHTHGTFYMMYYIFFLINGYFSAPPKEKKTKYRGHMMPQTITD